MPSVLSHLGLNCLGKMFDNLVKAADGILKLLITPEQVLIHLILTPGTSERGLHVVVDPLLQRVSCETQ